MAIAYVGEAHLWNQWTAGAVAVPLPACQAGDWLLMVVFTNDSTNPTTPSGWTLVDSIAVSQRQYVFAKLATSGDSGSSVPVTMGTYSAVRTSAWRGATGLGAAASSSKYASGSPYTITSPTVSSTASGLAVSFFSTSSSSGQGEAFTISGGVAQYNDGAPTYITACATDSNGGVQASTAVGRAVTYATTVALRGNNPPNAPTLTSPANSATLDRGGIQRFAWEFSDSDAGDSQSKYDLRYRLIGAGIWTTVSGTTPNSFRDFAAGAFVAGDYEWQVRTYDSQGSVGTYSSSSFFTTADAPPTPTFTDPINGQTISTQSYEAVISAPNVDAVQWRSVADNAGVADPSTVYQDSGIVTVGDLRRHTFTFPVNNRVEHLQASIRVGGLWSPWADSTNPISYTPPVAPEVTKTPDPANAALIIGITNPAPGAGVPAAAYNDVEIDDHDGKGWVRKATMLPTNQPWTYWLARSGVDTGVKVITVATNGTTATTEV